MRSPVRTSREQVDKENKPPKNIGELSPIVRAKLKHQESGQQQSSTSTHTPLQNRDKYEHLKPLSSTRDPRRRKLQSHLPFAPFPMVSIMIKMKAGNETNQKRKSNDKKGNKTTLTILSHLLMHSETLKLEIYISLFNLQLAKMLH